MRAVKFVKYEKALIQALSKISGKLVDITKALRTHLESLRYFDTVKATIANLAEWEKKFYNVQQDALRQIPKALAELDARLMKVLAQTTPKEMHTVVAGVHTDKVLSALPAKQRIRDTPGKALGGGEAKASDVRTKAKPESSAEARKNSRQNFDLSVRDNPDPVKPPNEAANTKRQSVADAAAEADREQIARLSKEGEIGKAQAILQPYVDAAKSATTIAEKKAAMNAIIERLDVTSEKEKMFWSGNKDLAKKIAEEKGKIILELTPGGRVIDDWKDLNNTFSWNPKDMEPHGWDLWGKVSAKYSKDALGEIDIIQDIEKFPSGGPTWRGSEWTTIVNEGRVNSMNIFGMSKDGRVLEMMKLEPDSEAAKKLFEGVVK